MKISEYKLIPYFDKNSERKFSAKQLAGKKLIEEHKDVMIDAKMGEQPTGKLFGYYDSYMEYAKLDREYAETFLDCLKFEYEFLLDYERCFDGELFTLDMIKGYKASIEESFDKYYGYMRVLKEQEESFCKQLKQCKERKNVSTIQDHINLLNDFQAYDTQRLNLYHEMESFREESCLFLLDSCQQFREGLDLAGAINKMIYKKSVEPNL